MADTRPKKPSDVRVREIRLQHPEDPTKIIQLELTNTGLLTSDGIERWSISTSPAPPSSSSKITPLEGDLDVIAPGTAQCLGSRLITGVTQLSQTFEVLGDWSEWAKDGDSIEVTDSTGNDGTYTCDGDATFAAGVTTITVVEAIPDATVDGYITLEEVLITAIEMQAKLANTGLIAVGSSTILVSATTGIHLSAEMLRTVEAQAGGCLDLNDLWCDVGVAGEGVQFSIWR